MNPQQNNTQNIGSIIKTTPKDFFFHLGATIALYTVLGTVINLLFTVINYYFPDALAGNFYGNPVAWAISTLVVVMPILYVLEWLIGRDVKLNPLKSEIWINKWRVYLTLFLAGIVIAGDVVTLINTYLNGEVSARFIYKFLVILVVLGIVFSYYILERLNKSLTARNIMAYLGILIVAVAIILGFVTVGSPAKQRAIRFDNERVGDLQNIQGQITNFWQQKGKLPASLAELEDPTYGSKMPVDPQTDAAYEYKIVTNTPYKNAFELCAVFSLKTQDIKNRGEYGGGYSSGIYDMRYYPYYEGNGFWDHEAGHSCFTRPIDPERYPVNKPVPVGL